MLRSVVGAALALVIFAGSRAHAESLVVLGTAADYAVLQFNEANTGTSGRQTQFSISSSTVNGPLGSAADTKVNFSGNPIPVGPLDQSTVNTGGSHYDSVTPQKSSAIDAALAEAVADAKNASTNFAGLTATQTVNSVINGGQTFTGDGGVNVIDLTKGIKMTGSSGITISGTANDVFVFNVSSSLVSNNGASITLDGISASQIIWNYLGTSDASFTGGNHSNTWDGTVLAVDAKVKAHDRTFNGALISGVDISITSNALLNYDGFSSGASPVPGPSSLVAASTAALAGLIFFGRHRRRSV